MGVPFSHEIQKASEHIDNIAPTVITALRNVDTVVPYVENALWAITWASIILPFLIGALLLAVIALLITVNPDLEQERKLLVTPLLRICLKMPRVLLGISAAEATTRREREQPERGPTRDIDNRINIGDYAVHSQSRRRASSKYE
ncbi:hypothetical protein N431DRAFT_98401 [Stipitochalara longipes BDJ]|nr:hypothetical protein N431DRAFT_98401 [Stipitochalara longipes BDJ]